MGFEGAATGNRMGLYGYGARLLSLSSAQTHVSVFTMGGACETKFLDDCHFACPSLWTDDPFANGSAGSTTDGRRAGPHHQSHHAAGPGQRCGPQQEGRTGSRFDEG